ncbi:MAG TPA: NADH-quinone oxidoreductase subunit L [Aggregatilineales bacterium]|nr:NADH-quinone oxidoreductase subunit L [Aggregatilineales bacterium]
MEQFASLVPLVVFIPLLGMLLNMFLGKYIGERGVAIIAVLASGLAFGTALTMAAAMAGFGYPSVIINVPLLTQWLVIPSAGIYIPFQLRVDTLSLTMMLVVTGVGTLIHIYATGYMHGDPRYPRFFMYMNLFLAFMLVLVTGNNFLITFIGWEGVGLCSFLLIGFWFDKAHGEGWKNSNAARKAFIVNRIGDYGFLLAIFLTFWTFGTLDYYKPGEAVVVRDQAAVAPAGGAAETNDTVSSSVTSTVSTDKGVFGLADDWLREGRTVHIANTDLPIQTVITLITLLMLVGVTGKSAQIPLFVWLPDAMAGPTPVSALIHAATMVTAGIFLITRSNVLYSAAPFSQLVVTLIGAATALMAGFIAAGQWDIKKVLAYSTISQLGFMVAGVGLGGYSAGMFHLVTHSFFKALLFLGAGSVIHGVEHGHHLAHEKAHDHALAPGQVVEEQAGGQAATGREEAHHEEPEEEVFDAQDMRNMGGLRHKMPITYWTYLIGMLALSGIFPFAGFWSKDEILGRAFTAGSLDGRIEGEIALLLLLAAAGFTGFYMWRQICLVFLSESRTDGAANAVESGPSMTWPLIILAFLSVFGGWLNLPEAFAIPSIGFLPDRLTGWLEHSVVNAQAQPFNVLLALTALAIAIGAILAANSIYREHPLTKKGRDRLQLMPETRAAFNLANAKLYWDEMYARFVGQPFNDIGIFLADTVDQRFWHDFVHNTLIAGSFNALAGFLSKSVDLLIIDRSFLNIGTIVAWTSERLRRIQTGYVRTYAFTLLLGVLMVLLLILFPIVQAMLSR